MQYAREEFVLQHWNAISEGGESLIINGKGRFFEEGFSNNPKYNNTGRRRPPLKENMFETQNLTKLPLASFFVTRGHRYRFRVMQPGFTLCPVLVTIEGHKMFIISSDTGPVKPQVAKSFVIHSGER